jgi:flagellar export protein FliJ
MPAAERMRRRQSLELLIELGRHARDQAAVEVAKALRVERKERDLRETLDRYQDDYRQATPKRQGAATAVTQIECHRRFVDRLDDAVQDQQQREGRAVVAREITEQALGLTERRIKVLERLRDRRQAAERRRDQLSDQKATDEQAALLARRSRPR